ncbi:hypothetical protein GCM10009661_60720 [Catellatospora chokoriensis]|uniref:HAMP domain-containing protein n=2 Tax=Catellatospora chokoriensis TaxID=310353 RepID=A0A8J3JXS9_9ACTN|nr:hypothetical protein Cch02nite_64800 [Catellatospora chokoriensis]
MRAAQDKIVGAVLLEYTPLYRQLFAAGDKTRQIIVTASVTGMAAALALGYVLARGLVRDLRRLTVAADLLASGDASARAVIGSRGELGELATAFNDMAAQIAAQKAALTELAARDPLTGLLNRRAFESRMGEALAHAGRAGAPMALLRLDFEPLQGGQRPARPSGRRPGPAYRRGPAGGGAEGGGRGGPARR